MRVTADTIEKLGTLYKERLESELISELSCRLQVDAPTAMEMYYQSELAREVDAGAHGIQYLSPAYLVDELLPTGFGPESYLEEGESASKPRNKLIATTLYRSGDIEIYGTGLQRIKATCSAANVPFSVTQSKHGVHVSFTRSEAAAESAQKADVEVPKSSEEFRRVPKISRPICRTTNMPPSVSSRSAARRGRRR